MVSAPVERIIQSEPRKKEFIGRKREEKEDRL
jgi:hypothetical protein